jgi:hypothetical protein
MPISPLSIRLRTAGAAVLLGLVGCQQLPTLESIKYGYSPSRADIQPEPPRQDDYNDVAAAWAPERRLAGSAPDQQPLIGWDGQSTGGSVSDGSPVGTAMPGAIMQTQHPMNDGVAAEAGAGGSRGTMLDKYLAVVEELDILRPQNEDLQLAVEMSEMRAEDFEQQLKSMQIAYDELGGQKQTVDGQILELAARLATAQIARLESERALLEATLEWRKMSAANNQPLGSQLGAGQNSNGFAPANGGARRK